MNLEDISILWYKKTESKKFGYWISFRDRSRRQGKAARKSMISFFESGLGPMGVRWQYQKCDDCDYILKLNEEKDLLFFLLRIKN